LSKEERLEEVAHIGEVVDASGSLLEGVTLAICTNVKAFRIFTVAQNIVMDTGNSLGGVERVWDLRGARSAAVNVRAAASGHKILSFMANC
jgi:hypothetical protein